MKEATETEERPPKPEFGRDVSSTLSAESYVSATIPVAGVTAIKGRKALMSQLAATLGRLVGMPFWDQTGLLARYDFAFHYSPDGADDSPSLATALQENLGLALKKQRGLLEKLVIDYIESPLEN